MAWTTPRTFVAAAVLSAAQLNENRDNWNAQFPLGAPAWTGYTPTLTQSGAVTKTVTYAKYTQIGKTIISTGILACTGAGTANAIVTVSLPVTAATGAQRPIGSGHVWDGGGNIPGICELQSTTTLAFMDSTQKVNALLGQTGTAFAIALASGMLVGWDVHYEAA
jgi:hypothetical protein